MRLRFRRAVAAASATAAFFGLAFCGNSCGPREANPDNGVTRECSASRLPTVREGILTIGTDNPALEPWYTGNDPSNGEGFESAVGYRIAVELGYHPHNVSWRRIPFRYIIAGGQKPFDIALDEVTIRPDRAKNVDFSTPYFAVAQAVLVDRNGKFAKANTIEGLQGARLGALNGTTSFQAVVSTIKPSTRPSGFDSMSQAIDAFDHDKIDGIVTDLPTAFDLVGSRVGDGKVIGQLPTGGHDEQFGVVLPKGSELTGCVDKALAKLKQNGTLADLTEQWTVEHGAPVLK